jgi:hypothetical protein
MGDKGVCLICCEKLAVKGGEGHYHRAIVAGEAVKLLQKRADTAASANVSASDTCDVTHL